eukprot:EG_transcript_28901
MASGSMDALIQTATQKITALKQEGRYPGTEYKEESDIMQASVTRMLTMGIGGCIVLWGALRWFDPRTFSQTAFEPRSLLLRSALGLAALQAAYRWERAQLLGRVSEAPRSVLCDELCPAILAQPAHFADRDVLACQRYCRRSDDPMR